MGLVRVFGKGPAGFVAASAIGWLTDQIRESKQPERLDTARLVPGETYLVTTRPGMNRAERRDAKKLRATQRRLAKVAAPSRTARRTAVELAAAQRRVAKAKPGTKRLVRNERKVEVYGARFDRLVAPTPKQQRLEQQVAALSVRMDEHRTRAIAKATGGKRRPPRTRTFT